MRLKNLLSKMALSIAAALYLVVPVGAALAQEAEAPAAVAEPEAPTAGLAELDTFINAVIENQMRSMDIPAATVSIVKDGKVVFARGYGYADAARTIKVAADKTLFRPGSTSKLFTWTAVMQLVEQGKLDLNVDVNTYLKSFQIPDTFDEPITLTHILTHTAGFEEGGLGYLIIIDPDNAISLREAMAKYVPRRLNKPGVYSSYSNYATALAGLIVENVSGTPFNDYIKANIFDPLGMASSSFHEPLPENLIANMAEAQERKAGIYATKPFEIIANFAPAGSLSSTATDMASFMLAHLNGGRLGGGQILKPETTALMHTRLFSHDPRMSGMAHGFYEQFVNGHRLIGHGGDTFSFHSNLMLDEAENLGIFVSYMGAQGSKARGELIQEFYDKYYPVPLVAITPSEGSKERVKKYAGRYSFWRHNESTIEKAGGIAGAINVVATADGTLLLAFGGGRQFVEIGKNLFRQVDGTARIAFGEDENGNIQDLFLDAAPFMAASRAPAAASPLFGLLLPGFSFLMFLTVWVGWLYRRKEFKTMTGGERTAIRLSLGTSGLNLFFLVMMGMVLAVYQAELFSEIPFMFKAALLFPNLAAIAGLATAWFAVKAWREGYWRRGRRIHFTLVAFASVFMAWFYFYWNFLGFNYP